MLALSGRTLVLNGFTNSKSVKHKICSKYMLLDDNNTKDLKAMLDANILALCVCTREAVKSMKKREVDGHIININSIFGHKVNTCVPGTKPINGMYPACKYALTAITECLRQEVLYLEMSTKITVKFCTVGLN